MQTAAHIKLPDMKRWEASKWSPEAVFKIESSCQASEPIGKASPSTVKHHLRLQAFHIEFGVPRCILELTLTSKASCSASSPGLCRYGFPGTAHNTMASGTYSGFYKAQRIRRSNNKLFSTSSYKTQASSPQLKGNSLLTSLFFIEKPEKHKGFAFYFYTLSKESQRACRFEMED